MQAGIFAKIAQAKAGFGSSNIRDGKYILEIGRLLIEQKRKGTHWIAELIVVEASKVNALIEPNMPGSTAGWVMNLDTNEAAPGNAKAFLLALYGESEPDDAASKAKFDQEFASVVELAVNTDPAAKFSDGSLMGVQPCKGMRIACETFHKPSKKGADLLLYRWNAVSDNTDENVAARRAAQEKAPKA